MDGFKLIKLDHHWKTGEGQEIGDGDKSIWYCFFNECEQFFESEKQFRKHQILLHDNIVWDNNSDKIKTYICSACRKKFTTKREMEGHRLVHEGKFKCKDCNEVQTSAFKYSIHLSEHRRDAKYPCPICEFVTAKKLAIAKHFQRTHLEKYPYVCRHCGEDLDDVANLAEHEKLHAGISRLLCEVCQEEFCLSEHLLEHQRKNHMVTSIDARLKNQCEICKKIYSSPNALKIHTRNHEEDFAKTKPYQCELCGQRFSCKFYLMKHIRRHTGEKLLKCNFCEKTFLREGDLLRHERTHTGEKPYRCELCDKCFGDKSHLIQHTRIHAGDKPYKCIHCGKDFSQASNLRQHERIHTGEKPFGCEFCDKYFRTKSTLMSHSKICKEKKEDCLNPQN
ncbi:hypothetical protein MML48_1g19925 [Holotrichia oblita]|uniref:Uncharacterized protein n=1 Tax=Holotrichia oblita TaxID=644536 RepID=A0ACB9TXM0_HOLOL|nr:hypothetical protein MML48_1g19925 [Holotrichia oblita]